MIDQPVTPHTLLVKGCNCECAFNCIQVLKEEIVAFDDGLIGFFFHDCGRESISVQAFFSLKRLGFHFHVEISITFRDENFEVTSFAHDQRFLSESIYSFCHGKVDSPKDNQFKQSDKENHSETSTYSFFWLTMALSEGKVMSR